ncbi:hypothetical protein ARMGADRAFT_1021801 [Armillaria gallica]|uniref:Uncharacterized protein n=1 Tax=Armillaria gallica TaxID=47427 RepID=A0A2H3EA72_ARMGA|nr:hypothetical protein ARMGADRAFT_1021801 [Armillaria gallica]
MAFATKCWEWLGPCSKGKKTTLDDFWKKIVVLFLEEFGINTEDEELLKFWHRRLKHWFNNHSNKEEPSDMAVQSLLPKADTQHLKPIKLYSQLYYPTHVKAAVKTKIEEEAIPKLQVLNCIHTMTQEVWLAESEEVMKLWTAQAKPEPSNAYNAIEVQVSKFISALGAATGGCISIFFGACDPNAGRKIHTHGYHFGKNPEGKSFTMVTPNYTKRFLKPFTSFVKKVFPPEVCAARTLVKKTEDNDADAVEEEADKSPPVPPVKLTEPNDRSPPAPPVKPLEPNVNPTPVMPPASPTDMGDIPPIKKTGDGKKTDTNVNIINANLDANDTEGVDADSEDTSDSADVAIANDNGLSNNADHAGNAIAVEPSINAEGGISIQPPVKAWSCKHTIQAVDIVVTP